MILRILNKARGAAVLGVVFVLESSSPWGAAAQFASPESVGFSSQRLERIAALMQRMVDKREYPGIVTLLARHGKIVRLDVFGMADLQRGTGMTNDTIFRIFSMSKPITGVAMMLLYEEGKWNPQETIERYIPEFTGLKVYKDLNGYGQLVLEKPAHVPRMWELMTHTAGFTYGAGESPVDRFYRDDQGRSLLFSGSLQDLIAGVSKAPLLYQPGTHWFYSLSVDIQGYLVEKLSGTPLPEFMKKRLFEPLGMKDTGFFVPSEKRNRFAALYRMSDTGSLVPTQAPYGLKYTETPALPQGGAGLVSTVMDYYRFAQMLLNGGELDGTRILGPSTVKLLMSNYLSDEVKVMDFNGVQMRPGIGYGFDGAVVTDPAKAVVPLGRGTYLWDGAAGTWFWVDPVTDIVFVGMVQRLGWSVPNERGTLAPDLEELSRNVVYQALVRPER